MPRRSSSCRRPSSSATPSSTRRPCPSSGWVRPRLRRRGATCSRRRAISCGTHSGSASSRACSSGWPFSPPTSSATVSEIGTILGKANDLMNDRERSEYFLERLVAVPSVSGDESAVVEVCEKLMAEVGLSTRRRPCAGVEGAVNVEGVLGSARPKLCIAGHVDTIPFDGMTVNPLGERRNGRYYGRGTTDMKGGLAAVLAAVDRLVRAGARLRGQLVVVGTASEETLKCGGYQLAQDHHDADGVVCAEPSDGRVAVAATGSLALRLDAYGTGAHSSVPGGGNAILGAHAAAKAVVDALTETVDVRYVGPRRRAVNVGVVRGGIAQPVVPQRCTVWLDVRYFVGETAGGLMQRVDAACRQAVAEMPGVRVEASQQRLDYEGRPYERGTWGDFIHVERGM